MAYDEGLADRIRRCLGRRSGLSEKRMFGGLAFMLRGNMCCGVVGDRVMLRLGKPGAAAALEEPDVSPMDFTGKPMSTMVFLEPEGHCDDAVLQGWVTRAAEFAAGLKAK